MSKPPVAADETGFEIAVIGMSIRAPGANNTAEFWSNLQAGVESISFFDEDQLAAAGIDPVRLQDPRFVPAGGVIEGIEYFDAGLFGYPPREAAAMDPQQRVFLECCWEALEDGGYDPTRYDGLIGAFGGVGLSTYLLHNLGGGALDGSIGALHAFLGNDKDHAVGRVAYKLGLRGPAVAVQTACSSSLTAVHLACQSLIGGECDIALAGGVSITVPQTSGYLYEEGAIYSPDGHCRAFDADARGTVGGNGAAVVLLKRLESARDDGDIVNAVIKGSAMNNDGAEKIGYTAPSVEGQAFVIRAAQSIAGVEPESVSYVEAHGTATELGDVIEMAALTRAFRARKESKKFCAIGSVKTNIGHLDSAAGVAGLIKVVLALRHKQIPASLHFERPNPEIDFDNSPFFVNDQLRAWETGAGPRRAGVSSFGIGGTNVHVVLEEAAGPAEAEEADGPGASPSRLLLLSAQTEAALDNAIANLHRHLADNAESDLEDVAYTLQVGRRRFAHRSAVVAKSRDDALRALEAKSGDQALHAHCDSPPDAVTFMFSGQGSQFLNMGLELRATNPVFAERLDRCARILAEGHGFDLFELLYPHDPEAAADTITQTSVAQPALFAVEWALAGFWESLGVSPDRMIGHSLGEYVAACLAGVFSLEDALAVVVARGRLMQDMPSGAMMVVDLPAAETTPDLPSRVSVAAINEPGRCVVSGPHSDVEALEASLRNRGVGCRRLQTSHAFHSEMMEPVRAPFTELLETMQLGTPKLAFVSNVTGTWITEDEATSPQYWAQHLRQAVRFSEGVGRLFESPSQLLVEVGPGRALASAVSRHPDKTERHIVVASMPQAPSGADTTMEAVARVWLSGVELNGRALNGAGRRIPLPTYPFQRRRHWVEPEQAAQVAIGKTGRIDNWAYLPAWTRVGSRRGPGLQMGGRSLVLHQGTDVGASIIAEMRRRGAPVSEVLMGNSFAASRDAGFTIDFRDPGDYDRLVEALLERSWIPRRVVHLAGDGAGAHEDVTDLSGGFYSLLFLLQALAKADVSPVELVAVTRGAHEVTGEEQLSPAAGAISAACRAFAQEDPALRCRAIDLAVPTDGVAPDPEAERLVDEIMSDSQDAVVAIRGRHRWIPEFEPVLLPQGGEAPAALRPGGAYVVVGGLGGVGLEIAACLSRSMRPKLALLGRTALPPEADWDDLIASPADDARDPAEILRRLRRLQENGAEVMTIAADATDRDAMQEALTSVEARFGAIDGVFHAAGAELATATARDISPEECERVMAPKVRGLEVLGDVLRDRTPDFCWIQSSLSSVLGAAGFSAYAAAHGFMDTFVQQRDREGGVRWATINWDNWYTWRTAPSGLPADRESYFMSPEEGAEAFARVLSMPLSTQLLISTGDLGARFDRWVAGPLRRTTEAVAGDGEGRQGNEEGAHDAGSDVPTTPTERTLAGIWGETLGIGRIGTNDNYFDLGGDSVTAIQIVSKAAKAGLSLKVDQLMEHQTIAQLAPLVVARRDAGAEHGDVSGEVPLTPIQRWFFARRLPTAAHFNLSTFVAVEPPIEANDLRAALDQLVARHDALRLRFPDPDTGFAVVDPGARIPLEEVDLSKIPGDEMDAALQDGVCAAEAGLDLGDEPVRAVLFDLGPRRGQRLALVIHHLLVDVAACGILLEDLEALCAVSEEPGARTLPAATTPYARWAQRVAEHGQSEELRRERRYWVEQARASAGLPVDAGGPDTEASAAVVAERLDADMTGRLLSDLARDHRASPTEIMLTVLADCLPRWAGGDSVLIDVEENGRDALSEDMDLSRTVGWFTTIFPVRLEASGDAEIARALPKVKEQIRSVAHRGIGFGLLSYPAGGSTATSAIVELRDPEASFVYLGRFGDSATASGRLRLSDDVAGYPTDPAQPRSHKLQIAARVRAGRFEIEWRYSRNVHHRETIENLARKVRRRLEELIEQCSSSSAASLVASDFPDAGLSAAQLEGLMSRLSGQDPEDDAEGPATDSSAAD